jgi:hypothetical protein
MAFIGIRFIDLIKFYVHRGEEFALIAFRE